MSFSWVAGALRGRALARRRLGDDGVEALAATVTLRGALDLLSTSSYGHRLRPDFDVPRAQRAIAETSAWHLRVLAGWLPPRGVQSLRAIAGWFELLDIEDRALAIATRERWNEPSFPLGALATIRPRVVPTTTLHGLRVVLAHSEWGDPGGDDLSDVLLGLRLGWSRRLRTVTREAREWGDGALTLAVAKGLFANSSRTNGRTLPPVPELGDRWRDATDLPAFTTAVPVSGRWVLHRVRTPSALWRAERSWWMRVDRDAAHLLQRRALGRTTAIAAAMLLVSDCWRTRAALEQAARGAGSEEATDARA
jgi:hypothetical protein